MRTAFLVLVPVSLALAQAPVSQNVVPQNTPSPIVMQLSLKRAVEISLTPEGSTRGALAMESVKQAQDRTREAKSAFLPTVDGAVKDTSETINLKTFGFNFALPFGFSIPGLIGPFSVFD